MANFDDTYITGLTNFDVEDFLGSNTVKLFKQYFQTVVDQEDDFQKIQKNNQIETTEQSISKQEGNNRVRGRIKIRIDELHRGLKDYELPWQLPESGFNNLFGNFQVPQRGQTILINFLNGDIHRPVYNPNNVTYKVRPYMNLKELKDTKIYDFVPLDLIYDGWDSDKFAEENEEDLRYCHQKYVFRLPPQWTENDDIDFDTNVPCKHSYFNDGRPSREYVDEFPRQEVHYTKDVYDPDILKKERPRFSDEQDQQEDTKQKLRNSFKMWGNMYQDELNNRLPEGEKSLTGNKSKTFFPNRHVNHRTYSPLDDELIGEFDSVFYFTPTDKRTLQYKKFSNSWNIGIGEYNFKERFFQGGRKNKAGGISESEQKDWGNRREKFTHNEIVRSVKFDGQISEKQLRDLADNKFENRIKTNFGRGSNVICNQEYPIGGGLEQIGNQETKDSSWYQIGNSSNTVFDKLNNINAFNDQFPIKNENNIENELKHKKIITYPFRQEQIEWLQNHENTFDNFYRKEESLQLNPFSYDTNINYINKDFYKTKRTIKEQKYYEDTFELDFRTQEDVSAGDNYRWDMKGKNGYTKLSSGTNRNGSQIIKAGNESSDEEQMKGEEEINDGSIQTIGDFLDFALYREQTQFVAEPKRDNIKQYVWGTEESGFNSGKSRLGPQTQIFGQKDIVHKNFEFNFLNSNIALDFDQSNGSGATYDNKNRGGHTQYIVEKYQEDWQDINIVSVNKSYVGLKKQYKVIEDFSPELYVYPEKPENFNTILNNDKTQRYVQFSKDLQITRQPKFIKFGEDNYRKRWDIDNNFFEEIDIKTLYYDEINLRKSRRDEKDERKNKSREDRKIQVKWDKINRFDIKHSGCKGGEYKEQQTWLDRKEIFHEPGLEKGNSHKNDRHGVHIKEEFYDMRNDKTRLREKLQNFYKSQNWEYVFTEHDDKKEFDMQSGSQNLSKTDYFWLKTLSVKDDKESEKGQDESLFHFNINELDYRGNDRQVKTQNDRVTYYYKDLYADQASQCDGFCPPRDCYGDKRRPMNREQNIDFSDGKRMDEWYIFNKKDSWRKNPFDGDPVKEHSHYVQEIHKMRPDPMNTTIDGYYEGSGVQHGSKPPVEEQKPHYGSIYEDIKTQYYEMDEWDPTRVMSNISHKEHYNQLQNTKTMRIEDNIYNYYDVPKTQLDLKYAQMIRKKIEQSTGSSSNTGNQSEDDPKRHPSNWWNEKGTIYYERKEEERVLRPSKDGSIYRNLQKIRCNMGGQTLPNVPSVQKWNLEEIKSCPGTDLCAPPLEEFYTQDISYYHPCLPGNWLIEENNDEFFLDGGGTGLKVDSFKTDTKLLPGDPTIMWKRKEETVYERTSEYVLDLIKASGTSHSADPQWNYIYQTQNYERHNIDLMQWEYHWSYLDKEDNVFTIKYKTEGVTTSGGRLDTSEIIKFKKHIHRTDEYLSKEQDISLSETYNQEEDFISISKQYTQKKNYNKTVNIVSKNENINIYDYGTQYKNLNISKKYTQEHGSLNYSEEHKGNVLSNNIEQQQSVKQKTYILVDGNTSGSYKIDIVSGNKKCIIFLDSSGTITIQQDTNINIKSSENIYITQDKYIHLKQGIGMYIDAPTIHNCGIVIPVNYRCQTRQVETGIGDIG